MLFNNLFHLISLFFQLVGTSIFVQFDDGEQVGGVINHHQRAMFSGAWRLDAEGLLSDAG